MVVGNNNGSDAQLLLNTFDLNLHFRAQLGIQIGKRLIQQQYGRPGHQSSGQSDPLLLAAGKLPGIAPVKAHQLNQLQNILYSFFDFRLFQLLQLYPKGNVFKNSHMGKQSIVLKENAYVSLIGRDFAYIPAVDQNSACIRIQKTGDHSQGGGLAAAAAPQQGNHLSVSSLQFQSVDGGKCAEALGKMV